MNDLFLKGKINKIVISISDRINYLSKIAKESNVTGSYLDKIIKKLEKNGIVILTKKDRRMFVELTDKGKKIKEAILNLDNLTK